MAKEQKIKIKVCGMRNPDNIKDLVALKPDYIGMIFYPKSKRFVGDQSPEKVLKNIPKEIKKVGVFVNATIKEVFQTINNFNLDLVQIHGDEPAQYCEELSNMGVQVIKAFGVGPGFEMNKINPYIPHCKYLLFDTKTDLYGGSGNKFDWELLRGYSNELPLFLSGGISLKDIDVIESLDWLNIHAVDLNSKFEIEPGLKNISMLEGFINEFRNKK